MSVTPAQRRTALDSLALPRLRELTALLDLHAFDGRSKEAHVSALLAKPDLDFPELLASLKREELKEMCEALGLARDGKTIAEIVQCVTAIGAPPSAGRIIDAPAEQLPTARKLSAADAQADLGVAIAYGHPGVVQ